MHHQCDAPQNLPYCAPLESRTARTAETISNNKRNLAKRSSRMKTMGFGRFWPWTTLTPTSDHRGVAGKVVEREKLHRCDRFPEWTESIFDAPQIAEKVQ